MDPQDEEDGDDMVGVPSEEWASTHSPVGPVSDPNPHRRLSLNAIALGLDPESDGLEEAVRRTSMVDNRRRTLRSSRLGSELTLGTAPSDADSGRKKKGVSILSGSSAADSKSEGPSKPSAFIKANAITYRSHVRHCVAQVLYHTGTETFIATLVLINLGVICLEIDARSEKNGLDSGEEPAKWVQLATHTLYTIFALELMVRFYVEMEQYVFFQKFSNYADAFILASGALEYFLWYFGVALNSGGVGMLRVLRMFRLLRLLRVVKLFTMLKELRKLMLMMGSCFKTLLWATLLLILVMTLWACIAVELLNPGVQILVDRGYWVDCDRCQRAFSTVFHSNLTIFKCIIAGDSWGQLAVPLVENYPWMALIFAGAQMTLVFGVLNLVIAVVVDVFAENRSKDVRSLAEELDVQEYEEKKVLAKIFRAIDDDANGCLSYDELSEGARKVGEFRNWLRVLDIDEFDLHQLFQIVDEDGSGEIDPDEFIEAMYRMKNTESKTATRFVKHLVTSIEKKQQSMDAALTQMVGNVQEVKENVRITHVRSTGTPQQEEQPQEEQPQEERPQDRQRQRPKPLLEECAEETPDRPWLSERSEEWVEAKLQKQEQVLQRIIEKAMTKASEVALEAALQAGSAAARKVFSPMRSLSKKPSLGSRRFSECTGHQSSNPGTPVSGDLASTTRPRPNKFRSTCGKAYAESRPPKHPQVDGHDVSFGHECHAFDPGFNAYTAQTWAPLVEPVEDSLVDVVGGCDLQALANPSVPICSDDFHSSSDMPEELPEVIPRCSRINALTHPRVPGYHDVTHGITM